MRGVLRGAPGFIAAALFGVDLAVQCCRSWTSSSRGHQWLLQGHCSQLINGPSYVAAVCLMEKQHTTYTCLPSPIRKQLVLNVFLFISTHVLTLIHTHLRACKERRGKWSTDLCFGSFSMETFVQLACLPLCQPGQCLSYELGGEIFICDRRGRHQKINWHRHTGRHTYLYTQKHKCRAGSAAILLFLWCVQTTAATANLFSCSFTAGRWPRLSEAWVKYVEFRIYILASWERNWQDWSLSADCKEISPCRGLGFCGGYLYTMLSMSAKCCQALKFS